MPNTNTTGVKGPGIFQGHPKVGFPFSYQELRKEVGRGPLHHFLMPVASRDVMDMFDDFKGKAIDTTQNWSVANGGGAGAASFAVNLQANGIIRGTTGTGNGVTASVSLIGPILWLPAANIGMEIRYKVITANTAIRFEAGFIDAVPGSNTAAFNNVDTPTAFAANAVTVMIDTAATANKLNLMTVGSASNQAVARSTGTQGLPNTGVYQTIRIQITSRDDTTANAADATAWVDGGNQMNADTSATAGVGVVNAATLLAPWVYFEATSATSKSLDIDYIHVWGQRQT